MSATIARERCAAKSLDAADLLTHAWLATPATFAEHLTADLPPELRWTFARHLAYIAEILAAGVWAAAAGQTIRLLVCAPVRMGKSELICRWLPAWVLTLFGHWPILLGSYEGQFAAGWGRKTRDTITEHRRTLGLSVRDDSSAANRWHTNKGGSMETGGIDGPFTGKGARLLIVDDPLKTKEQALSPTYRDKAWHWLKEDALSRLDPPGNLAVVTMARRHRDDPIGRAIREAREGGTQWRLISLPELAEEGDPLGRQRGERLWPARFTPELTGQRKRDAGTRAWASQHQQAPEDEEGALIASALIEQAQVGALGFGPARWWCPRCGLFAAAYEPGQRCAKCERPLWSREYLTAWDAARTQDWMVGITANVTETPAQIVAFHRFQKLPWPKAGALIEERAAQYPGRNRLDSTGAGDVLHGYLSIGIEPILFSGKSKVELVDAMALALESGEIKGPSEGAHPYPATADNDIRHLWAELADYRWDDEALIQDCVMALAMLCHGMRTARVLGGVA